MKYEYNTTITLVAIFHTYRLIYRHTIYVINIKIDATFQLLRQINNNTYVFITI